MVYVCQANGFLSGTVKTSIVWVYILPIHTQRVLKGYVIYLIHFLGFNKPKSVKI
jgi:hypothetical protein